MKKEVEKKGGIIFGMAQQPNQDRANGNAPHNNMQQEPQEQKQSELGAFLQQMQGVTMEKLEPLKLTKTEMNRMKVGELNNWVYSNLDQSCHGEYRARGNKENKMEWLLVKIDAVNADREEFRNNFEKSTCSVCWGGW